jgi:hypothetical protein
MRSLLQHWVTEQAERRPEAVALVMSLDEDGKIVLEIS